MSTKRKNWNVGAERNGHATLLWNSEVVWYFNGLVPTTAREWAETLESYRYTREQGLRWIIKRIYG